MSWLQQVFLRLTKARFLGRILLGMQREENGLLDVSSKRPAIFNVEHSNPDPDTNTKHWHSTHETLNMVSSALAAKVKQTLADPLLPGQRKRMIVLTTSDGEFEHSDDDRSWSSEEMGSEDEEVSFLRYIFFNYMYET